MGLWTYDLLLDEKYKDINGVGDDVLLKTETRISDIINNTETVPLISEWEKEFQNDAQLLHYRGRIPTGFLMHFKTAFLCYIEGDWQKAKKELQTCQEMIPEDGPTKVLQKVMQEYDFNAPDTWKGYRSLTSK